MAVIPYEILLQDSAVRIVKWVLGAGDTGRPIHMGRHSDRTIQVYGSFGSGGSIVPQGSNDVESESSTWFALRSPSELPITLTSADGKQLLEYTHMFRPSCPTGDGSTAITVLLCSGSTRG